MGSLSREDPSEPGSVMIESSWKPSLLPYHKQKLALVISNWGTSRWSRLLADQRLD
jgi:hypothetical protein